MILIGSLKSMKIGNNNVIKSGIIFSRNRVSIQCKKKIVDDLWSHLLMTRNDFACLNSRNWLKICEVFHCKKSYTVLMSRKWSKLALLILTILKIESLKFTLQKSLEMKIFLISFSCDFFFSFSFAVFFSSLQ